MQKIPLTTKTEKLRDKSNQRNVNLYGDNYNNFIEGQERINKQRPKLIL